MSIENAILELAAAIRYAADKNTTRIAGFHPALAAPYGEVCATLTEAAELEKAVAQVEADAKAEKQSAAKQAIADALAKAKAEKEAEAAPVVEETDPLLDDAPVELDYEKDVKPLLVKVGRDKQQLVDLLGKFNAKNGAGIAKADYPAVVAAANKIIGG